DPGCPTSGDAEGHTEDLRRHRGSLAVPAAAAGAPRAGPVRLPGLRRLPEGEVAGITLALVDLDARAGEKLVEVLAGEPSVRREPPDLEVHVAVHRVGEPLGDEALDERDHLG